MGVVDDHGEIPAGGDDFRPALHPLHGGQRFHHLVKGKPQPCLLYTSGISLPFFSYGGTSLVMLLAQMGVVLSVSRSIQAEKA